MTADIQENPAVGERVREGRPLWQTCCLGCLIAAAALVIAAVVVVRVFTGPGLENISKLPANYPSDLKLYRLDQATSMVLLRGQSRSKMLQTAASPLKLIETLFKGPNAASSEAGVSASSSALVQADDTLNRYSQQAQNMDTVTITWDKPNVTHLDVLKYYDNLFKQVGMTNRAVTEPTTATDYIVAARDNANMQIHLQTASDGTTISKLVIIVSYANSK